MFRRFRFGGTDSPREAQVAAFAHLPADARSACIAVVDEGGASPLESLRPLGAPILFVVGPNGLQWWSQTQNAPVFRERIPPGSVATFLEQHAEHFNPHRVYRAKTRARFEAGLQLDFVDAGLLPMIEAEAGKKLQDLVERTYSEVFATMSNRPDRNPEWILRGIFWLLAARILHDKDVPSFAELTLGDVPDTFRRLARHYGAPRPLTEASPSLLKALGHAAREIGIVGHMGVVTTETLAHVYETALVSKATRTELGTHSTPSYLIDYVASAITPWIEDVSIEERHIFEPACGHAAFLVVSMRLLRELAPQLSESEHKEYLRSHLHGIDIDPFALEVARLSLTLADVPRANGWDLREGDMFQGGAMPALATQAAVVFSNPPYERLRAGSRSTKAEEVARIITRHLKPGGIFGLVLPRTALHSEAFADVRREWVAHGELKELTLLPDKVFAHSEPEVALIIGRKRPASRAHRLLYRHVREAELTRFAETAHARTEQLIGQGEFEDDSFRLLLPELSHVWGRLNRTLDEIATVGQGFSHEPSLPDGRSPVSDEPRRGLVPGFARFDREVMIHRLPPVKYVDLSDAAIQRPRDGTQTGTPQVLLNYHPVSRGPWRLKAVIDRSGHPASSSFLVVRPRSPDFPLEYLWALLNSPLANAYAFSHVGKRNILAGLIRRMPIPRSDASGIAETVALVRLFLESAAAAEGGTELARGHSRRQLLQVDAVVMRLYGLPPRIERDVLDMFAESERSGVPFSFTEYFPRHFEPCLPLGVFLSLDERSTGRGLAAVAPPDPNSLIVRASRIAREELDADPA